MLPFARVSLRYPNTLSDDRRAILDRYELKDIAIKVVGVGSVGTYCVVMTPMAAENDPLFLQLKEAHASVLEACAGKSTYSNHGQRVVMGHRLMQSASDIFLGWTEGREGRQFYIRQLRDAKMKPMVETFNASDMAVYAQWCGYSLARSHARSGDARRSAATSARAIHLTGQSQISLLPMLIKPSATTLLSRRRREREG